MSFDSRIRDELRHATEGHDLREEAALQHVKATPPAEWADMPVVALEERDSPQLRHARAQRIVAALAAAALIAGAVALPVALHSRSRDTTPRESGGVAGSATCGPPVATGYRSTVAIRVAESPPTPTSSTTLRTGERVLPNPPFMDPVKFALSSGICKAALERSHLRAGDPAIGFEAGMNATGDTVSLTVITPTAGGTTALARNWAEVFRNARIVAARNQIRQQQHQLSLRVAKLHRELRKVDERLVKMMPVVYKGVLRFDAEDGMHAARSDAPPPVPEQGTPAALNLAFERIQILSSLSNSGEKAASLRITLVKPDIFATVISQSPAALIKAPHRDTNTSTVLIAIGLLLGGGLLAGSAFWLGRRTRRPQPS